MHGMGNWVTKPESLPTLPPEPRPVRLPHPRFRLRLRSLLIAVGIAGLGLGGWTMWQRREYYLERADRHSTRAAEWYRLAERNRQRPPTVELERLRASIAKGRWMPTPGLTAEEQRRTIEETIAFEERGLAAETARWQESIRAQVRNATYHEALAEKYRNAARRPWVRPAPDPPSP